MANEPRVGDRVDEAAVVLSIAFMLYKKELLLNGKSQRTITAYTDAYKSLLSYFKADIAISDLTFDSVRDYAAWLQAKHIKNGSVRVYLIKLRCVLSHLQQRGYTVLDPRNIPLPKKDDNVPAVMSPAEISSLIDVAHTVRDKAMISLLYSTGLRVSEMLRLDRQDVREDYFTVRQGKGGYSRICFIDQRTRALLDDYLASRSDEHPALFFSSARKVRLQHQSVEFLFRRWRRQAGFTWNISAHTLRHSFATNLMKNGAGLYSVSKLLGHKNLNTTAIYLHLVDNELNEVFEKYHTV